MSGIDKEVGGVDRMLRVGWGQSSNPPLMNFLMQMSRCYKLTIKNREFILDIMNYQYNLIILFTHELRSTKCHINTKPMTCDFDTLGHE